MTIESVSTTKFDETGAVRKQATYGLERLEEIQLPKPSLEGANSFIKVHIPSREGERHKTIDFFLKIISPQRAAEIQKRVESLSLERYKEKFKEAAMLAVIFRNHEIPVPSTVRYFEQKDGSVGLIVSDLSEGGKYTVWSVNNIGSELVTSISSINIEEIHTQIADIAKKAAETGYTLNADSYFVLIGQDIQRVVVGDLGFGVNPIVQEQEYKIIRDDQVVVANPQEYNQFEAKKFVDALVNDMSHS